MKWLFFLSLLQPEKPLTDAEADLMGKGCLFLLGVIVVLAGTVMFAMQHRDHFNELMTAGILLGSFGWAVLCSLLTSKRKGGSE